MWKAYRADYGPTTPPTDFIATFNGTENKIVLTWNYESDITDNFKIERSSDGGSNYTQIAEIMYVIGTTSYEFINSTDSPQSTYNYRVRACNSAGISYPAVCDYKK